MDAVTKIFNSFSWQQVVMIILVLIAWGYLQKAIKTMAPAVGRFLPS